MCRPTLLKIDKARFKPSSNPIQHPTMSESPICMICQEDTQTSTNPFLTPCRCKGSISSIHRECLEKWMEYSNRSRCTVCNTKYRIYMKHVVTPPNKFKLMLLSALYGMMGFLFLAAFFFHQHTKSYAFANASVTQTLDFVVITTYSHIAIYLWIGFLSLISILTVLMYVFAFLAMCVGDFEPMSSLTHTKGDAELMNLLKKTLYSYPLEEPIVPQFFYSVLCFLSTGVIFYGIYKILLVKNPPTIRTRIQL